jgi:hypothetical protein
MDDRCKPERVFLKSSSIPFLYTDFADNTEKSTFQGFFRETVIIRKRANKTFNHGDTGARSFTLVFLSIFVAPWLKSVRLIPDQYNFSAKL